MNLVRSFLLIFFVGVAFQASSQTDPNVVPVDSSMANPDLRRNPPPRTATKDSTTNIRSATERKNPPVVKDSARLALERMPRRAVTRSAIIPGWGQVTNGRWWKVPVIYGGFVGLGYAISWNNKYYHQYLNAIKYYRENGAFEPGTIFASVSGITDQSLIPYKDYYRRNRDLSILGCGALYAVNLIDAYVDAKFFRFDISDELSLKISPTVQPGSSFAYAPVPVLKFKLSL